MNTAALFRKVLLLALMVSVLVLEGGYMLLTLLLAGFGLAHGRQLPATFAWVRSSSGASTVMAGLGLYLVVGVLLGVWHSYKINYYEAFVPFVLAPLVLHGVLSFKMDHRVLWLATAVGAFFALFLAAYQVFWLDVGRAFGGLKNPIIFGDLSIVFGAIALLGFVYCPRDAFPKGVRWFLLAGFFFGLGASLLSGSKGGWMSVFLILFVFVWTYFSHRSVGFRLAAYGVGLLVVTKLFLLAPSELVLDRIVGGLGAGWHWFQTGEVTDGSVSVRLELWRRGILMFDQNWLMGLSTGLPENLSAQMASIGLPWFGGNLENDLLQTLVSLGLVGFVGKLGMYGLLFWGFLKFRNSNDVLSRGFSAAGGLLVMLYLEFGLSVIVLGHNSFRHVLVVLCMMLLALLLQNTPSNKSAQ